MNQARQIVHCTEPGDSGLTGRGVGVAVLDTGIYPHEDFGQRITAFFDVLHRRGEPYDDNGHGTHISAIIGGSGAASGGRYRGIAPGCSLISIKVLDARGGGFASDVLTGLRWIRQNRDALGIRIILYKIGHPKIMGLLIGQLFYS